MSNRVSLTNVNNALGIVTKNTTVPTVISPDLPDGFMKSANGSVSTIPSISINELNTSDYNDGYLISSDGALNTTNNIPLSDVNAGAYTNDVVLNWGGSLYTGKVDTVNLSTNVLNKFSTIDASFQNLPNSSAQFATIDASFQQVSAKLAVVDASFQYVVSQLGNSGPDVDITLDDVATVVNSATAKYIQSFGTSWATMNTSPVLNGIGLACSGNGQYIMINGWTVTTQLSKDYGKTWSGVSDIGNLIWGAKISATGQYMVTHLNAGSLWISSDYGASWSHPSGGNAPSACVCINLSSSGKYMLCPDPARIHMSSDYGQTWTNVLTNNTYTGAALSSDGSVGYLINASTVWKSTDYGANWTSVYTSAPISMNHISCSGTGQYVLICPSSSAKMLRSSDYGATFSQVGTSQAYSKSAISYNGQYMTVVCNSGYTYVSSDFGATWTQTGESQGYWGVAMSTDASIVYTQYPNGKLYTSGSLVPVSPTFSAYANKQQTSIGNSVITFDTKLYDTNSGYDVSSGRWTPGVAGYYQINALVTTNNTGSGDIYTYLRKNGSMVAASSRMTTSIAGLVLNTQIYLTASDYVDMYCISSFTGSNTSATPGASTNQAWVYFNGCMVRS